MVIRKEPNSLRNHCLNVLPEFVYRAVTRLSSRLNAAQWMATLQGLQIESHELLFHKQVAQLRGFIFERVLCSDHSAVFRAVLSGVERAVNDARRSWRQTSDMQQYRMDVEHLAAFAELILVPNAQNIDFRDFPKGFRARIANNIETFAQSARRIVLGVEHKWILRQTANSIARHLASFQRLTVFSCKWDCSASMLRSLCSSACSSTLLVLDVEGSRQVDDSCLNSVLRFGNLTELNIFKTSLSDESKAQIMVKMRKLTRLIKADYLCDALGWIEYLELMGPEQTLELRGDLMPSQDYFFHETWQMEMASRLCPLLDTLSFSIDDQSGDDYLLALADFEHLANLELHGGNFYGHKIDELIRYRGKRLLRLNLIDVEDVDYRAIALISNCCVQLKFLGLMHCGLGDYSTNSDADPNSDEEYERRQCFLAMAAEAQNTIVPMLSLEELVLQSACSAPYITFICCRCPKLTRLVLGSRTEITDTSLSQIMLRDGLTRLESFQCESSRHLSFQGVQLLLNNCPDLKVISDLQHWTRLQPTQVAALRQSVIDGNVDLDTRSHQGARRLMEMSGDERRSYVNFITGPILERMRRRRVNQQHQ